MMRTAEDLAQEVETLRQVVFDLRLYQERADAELKRLQDENLRLNTLVGKYRNHFEDTL